MLPFRPKGANNGVVGANNARRREGEFGHLSSWLVFLEVVVVKRITFDPRELGPGWLDLDDPAQKLFGECLDRGLIHFLVDDDLEERYTALYVMGCARKAGPRTRLCVGFDDLVWHDGALVDVDDAPVETIWKTWMWETAFADQRRDLAEEGEPVMASRRCGKARLADLLRTQEAVTVFEPLWKVIPSNKGILPVLWELFPDHPNLLCAEWSPTEALRRSGYVRKPVVGRNGHPPRRFAAAATCASPS